MSRRPIGSIRWVREGVARVELQHGHDPLTGKPNRYSENVHGTQGDAERVLAQMLLDVGEMPTGGNLTFREFYERLYKPRIEKSPRIRKETRRGYFSKIELHVLPRFGEVTLKNLEPYVLEEWRDDLLEKMSGLSALHVYRAFSGALSKAVRWKRLKVNPLRDVDPPDAEERDIDTLDAKEAVAYLEAFHGHELEPLVILAIATGFRPCELYGLEWSDIDFSTGEIRVERGRHQLKGDVYLEPPKSKRSRRAIPLDAWALESLRPLRGLGVIIPITPAQIGYRYRKHIRESKLRYLPLRDLRHTHATLMLEAGIDIVRVSRRLGHSTVSITDKYYLRPKKTLDQAAADSFGELLALAGEKSPRALVGGKSTDGNE